MAEALSALEGSTDAPDGARARWYRVLDPIVESLSRIALAGKERWLREEFAGVDDGNIPRHEGAHVLRNTRYKEWWYFDAQLPTGQVVSAALVLSMARPHCFVWIYDPVVDRFETEIDYDGDARVAEAGHGGLDLACDGFSMKGDARSGYAVRIEGKRWRGEIALDSPIPGRAEAHWGPGGTVYALYQLPKFRARVDLRATDGSTIAGEGEGYHDHWWGVMHRRTAWAWSQTKYADGTIASFYDARYGAGGEDLHRYAWLYRPGQGYRYFDTSTLSFSRESEDAGTGLGSWSVSASGDAGDFRAMSRARAHRVVSKEIDLVGRPVGEVVYHQYPVDGEAAFTPRGGGPQDLVSSYGMLEWDWKSVW